MQAARSGVKDFSTTLRESKARLLQMHAESHVGHIGGNLSALDILMCLYHYVLGPDDQFILSKGHAAGALYVTLWSIGRITDDELKTFHADGTRFSGHPTPKSLTDLPFATGSLGHGLSLAAGLALVKSLRKTPGRVYCLLSDGEWQEGSTWEAVIFARRHALPVTLLVDTNGLQGFGTTAEVAQMGDLPAKIQCFGIPVLEIDGHDATAILGACSGEQTGPLAVVAHTHKGSGVSFMRDQMAWHYLPLSDEQYRQAVSEVLAQ